MKIKKHTIVSFMLVSGHELIGRFVERTEDNIIKIDLPAEMMQMPTGDVMMRPFRDYVTQIPRVFSGSHIIEIHTAPATYQAQYERFKEDIRAAQSGIVKASSLDLKVLDFNRKKKGLIS